MSQPGAGPTRRQAEERLLALIAHCDDAIIGKDLEGIITEWNPAAERIFGYLAEEAIGRHIGMLAPPDHADEIPAILERLRRGRTVEHFHTQRRRKDGTVIDVSLTVSPIRDADGTIIGASKISRDISDLQETRRLRALVADNNRLLHELNHRVGNNLAVILALLRREMKGVPPEHRAGYEAAIEKIFELASDHERRSAEAPSLPPRPLVDPSRT